MTAVPALLPSVDPPADPREFAAQIRKTVLRMCVGRGRGYAGQGLALADLLAQLYGRAMRRGPDGAYLDRFVLSTGHSAIGLFAALGVLGLYDDAELETYGADGSRIEESPLEGLPGFEITAGALGQGLSQALGIALGERMQGRDTTVYCLLSDGELQEGQVWEAAMAAGHHRVGNLIVLVDNNRMQADGDIGQVMEVEPVPEKFESFGFEAFRIDAHDHDLLRRRLPTGGGRRDRPLVLVCQTVPGKGVPILEQYRNAHYVQAEPAVWERALRELDEARVP